MKTSKPWIALGILLAAIPAQAGDNLNSELSHFAGNAALASVTTIVVDKYCKKVERPALTGFFISAAEAFIAEGVQSATGGEFSALDAVIGSFGAGVGACATAKWYLAPKLETRKGETAAGIVAFHKF